jgi:hypothetical protein
MEPQIAAAEVPELVAIGHRLGPELQAPPPATPDEEWGSWIDPVNRPRGGRCPGARLSDDDAATIRRLRASGWSRAELASKYSVSLATITRITTHRTYPPVPRSSPPPATSPVTSSAPSYPGHRWDRSEDRE